MSLTMIRPYFKARCESLGYKEHQEAFTQDNIARVQGKRFFLDIGSATSDGNDMRSTELTCPVTVSLYQGAGRVTTDLEDKALKSGEEAIVEILGERFGSNLKNVSFRQMTIEPIDASNDTSVMAKLEFVATVFLAF